jgi:hypothetical protein
MNRKEYGKTEEITHINGQNVINPLNAELNPICYLLALLELTIFSTLAG